MQKLKDKLPSLFGSAKMKNVTNGTKVGKLETDAVGVGLGEEDDESDNGNRRGSGLQHSTSAASTPTASADLTASVVRELSDPNYNSLEVMPTSGSGGELLELNGSLAAASSSNNTMNVHNAQQQVVMQFSNANNLHFGSVYNFNGATVGANSQKNAHADETDTVPAPDAGKRSMPRKTTSVVVMMQSQEEPNHRMLDTIATHLGEGWKEVMRELGQSNGQIEQAVIDHQMHGGIKEVIYQLLLQWLRNADDGVGTLGCITTLLWESNHRDCVQRMKLVWKSEAKRKTSR